MKKLIVTIITGTLFSACIKEGAPKKFVPKFVVEGIIENGEVPVVKVMHNVPSNFVIDEKQLEAIIVRWASVKVSGGGEEEFLTLTRNDKVFPYLFYVGNSLKGKAGQKYKLEVKYNNDIFLSETEIPLHKPAIKGVSYEWLDPEKAQPAVNIDNANPEANYLLFAKLVTQPDFYPSAPRGIKAIDQAGKEFTVALTRSRSLLDSTSSSRYYAKGDEIAIKVSNVSASSYTLWSAVAQQGLQLSFLNYSSNFSGNIEGNAAGIWYGANASVDKLTIK
ncbi:DUF4249 family protein [Pseudoflavitalea sp. G-6-1-2]|uniref:DUF4249 family protein n=1 Tax=Pseudoflavitalea sp. G-6-1-2 TaxID=2728841 RepID=UPI00146ABE1A|nr:DUF4249 family protein [Pseudoflavitalea sp. G-6-1-2]NML20110.1 DUF4249 family protein [Pseudoflavitalea sp. G-6-1-2]